MEGDLQDYVDYGVGMALRAPHLYALTVAYWGLVLTVLATRYVFRRPRISQRAITAVVVLGTVALLMAFIDVATRGRELIQLSLVAYFATPLGIGYYLIRHLDGRPLTGWRGIAVREVTYVTGFLAYVLLSVVDGDPWWFTRPEVDRSDPIALIENTNWLHLMATVFGLVALMEAASPLVTGASERSRRR